MEHVTLKVSGMTCGGCVASVKRVLMAVSGVESAEVLLEGGRAEVAFDPARVRVEQLRAAIVGAGYEVPI
jgi:copper chaperone